MSKGGWTSSLPHRTEKLQWLVFPHPKTMQEAVE